MGDSMAMTIEFLRARLLSERSVSRAARQRADQLAKRVVDLEEQLRLVSVQRKKAEKAAEEVLSILESQGIGDLSDTINSGSDQEELPCDDTVKEYESSATSRMDRSVVDDGLSGSEAEVSNSQGRSLSWKSHSNCPDSHEKQREKQVRQRQRRRSFMLTLESSRKHQLGLSCRKIKRKDMRSEADTETNMPIHLHAQGNGDITCSNFCNDQLRGSTETSKGMMKEAGADSLQVDDHNRQTEIHQSANGRERDEVMERILEQQAKLIGQFQAEENAQREWEDKYNENMTTLGDNKRGNQSCIAENSSQTRKEITEFADRTPDCDQAANSRDVHISNSEELASEGLFSTENNNGRKEASNVALSNRFMPRDIFSSPIGCCSDACGKDLVGHQYDGRKEASKIALSNHFTPRDIISARIGCCSDARGKDLVGHQYDGVSMTVQETKTISHEHAVLTPEYYGVIMNGKQNEIMSHDVYENHLCSHGIGNGMLEDPSSRTSFPIDNQNKLQKSTKQKDQMQVERQLPQTTSSSLGGVLEALQRAKLSLRQQLDKPPFTSQSMLAIAAPSQIRAVSSVNGLDIPISSASLFRLPIDSFPPSHFSGPKFYRSESTFPPHLSDVRYETSPHHHTNSHVAGGSRAILDT